MTYNFRLADPSEILQISLVLKQVYLETYAIEGVTKLFADFINEQFSEEKIMREMQSAAFDFWVATCDENPIGVLKVAYDLPCPNASFSAPEINKLYIMRRFFKKGIGRSLMAFAEKALKEKGEKKVWLQVWAENEGAIEFYKKVGYEVIGDVWFWIEENKYPNQVLVKKLDH